ATPSTVPLELAGTPIRASPASVIPPTLPPRPGIAGCHSQVTGPPRAPLVTRADPRIEVRVEILQLVPDLGLGLTADLLAAPLPIRAEAERDDTTPPAITALVVPAVTALSRVVAVDAIFAEPWRLASAMPEA